MPKILLITRICMHCRSPGPYCDDFAVGTMLNPFLETEKMGILLSTRVKSGIRKV